jgi:ankyrin repeat protein
MAGMRVQLAAALLLACGAERGDLTPLILAARAGDVPAIRALISSGGNLEARGGVSGWTPLMHAIHKNQRAVALFLLDAGADANARADRGATPLILAAGEGDVEVVKALLKRGADPRASTVHGDTALSAAVAAGHAAVIDALLSQDPELRLLDNFASMTARWLARLQGRTDVLSLLAR